MPWFKTMISCFPLLSQQTKMKIEKKWIERVTKIKREHKNCPKNHGDLITSQTGPLSKWNGVDHQMVLILKASEFRTNMSGIWMVLPMKQWKTFRNIWILNDSWKIDECNEWVMSRTLACLISALHFYWVRNSTSL